MIYSNRSVIIYTRAYKIYKSVGSFGLCTCTGPHMYICLCAKCLNISMLQGTYYVFLILQKDKEPKPCPLYRRALRAINLQSDTNLQSEYHEIYFIKINLYHIYIAALKKEYHTVYESSLFYYSTHGHLSRYHCMCKLS